MLNSPLKWVGGKSRLRKQIIQLIPDHTCYIEPFCGAAWVLFGKSSSKVEIINDIDGDLINFFRVIKNKPQEFLKTFEWDLVARAEFEELVQLNPLTLSDVDRAHRFYYLIMAAWGGEFNYPRFQTSITDGGHGNRLIGALKTLCERIEPIHERLSTVIIENLDWRECIDHYNRDGSFMYIDPPYPGNGVNYMHNMRTWEEHQELANKIKQTKCKWILSSYDNEKIRELYGDYTIIPVTSASGMRKKRGSTERVVVNEVFILNFDVTRQNIDSKNKLAEASDVLQQGSLL